MFFEYVVLRGGWVVCTNGRCGNDVGITAHPRSRECNKSSVCVTDGVRLSHACASVMSGDSLTSSLVAALFQMLQVLYKED